MDFLREGFQKLTDCTRTDAIKSITMPCLRVVIKIIFVQKIKYIYSTVLLGTQRK